MKYQGPHVHDWQYNEAKEVFVISGGRNLKWKVIRFCKSCHCVEDIVLEEVKK